MKQKKELAGPTAAKGIECKLLNGTIYCGETHDRDVEPEVPEQFVQSGFRVDDGWHTVE